MTDPYKDALNKWLDTTSITISDNSTAVIGTNTVTNTITSAVYPYWDYDINNNIIIKVDADKKDEKKKKEPGMDKVDKIIDKVKDIKFYNNRCVEILYNDGTKERAVCDKDDVFNPEIGMMICLIKKMLATDQKTGTYLYNKMLKKITKLADSKQKEMYQKKVDESVKKEKIRKEKERKERRLAKRKERRKQEIAEAILLANDIASKSD